MDPDNEDLDPRIQEELENLNKASTEINQYELSLDEERKSYAAILRDSVQNLDILQKKLSSSIRKARPYHDAKNEAKKALQAAARAAQAYERAISQHAAAKQMVTVAENGLSANSRNFDQTWQEMLNHATEKVNGAELLLSNSEIQHKNTTECYNYLEMEVKKLKSKLRASIKKSQPYYDGKSLFSQQIEEQKKRIEKLEDKIKLTKVKYSNALRSLEEISEEIHYQREKAKGGRQSGVGAEDLKIETPEDRPSKNVLEISSDDEEEERAFNLSSASFKSIISAKKFTNDHKDIIEAVNKGQFARIDLPCEKETVQDPASEVIASIDDDLKELVLELHTKRYSPDFDDAMSESMSEINDSAVGISCISPSRTL